MMQLPGIPDVDSIHSRHTSTTTPSSSPIGANLAERLTRRTTKASAFRLTDLSTLKAVPPSKGSKVMYTSPMMSPVTETSLTTTTTTVGEVTSTESSPNQSHVINRLVDVTNGSALEATTISSGGGLESVSTSSMPWNITYTSFPANSYSNCSAHFVNYTQPQPGEIEHIMTSPTGTQA